MHAFISYSHADKKFLDELKIYLSPVVDKLSLWDDSQIAVGDKWDSEIKKNMEQADIAILLVSPHFLASKFIIEVELPFLLDKAKSCLKVFWIPIRPINIKFTEIGHFQAAWNPEKPIGHLDRQKREKAWVEIINKLIETKTRTKATNHSTVSFGTKSRLDIIKNRKSINAGCIDWPPFSDIKRTGPTYKVSGLYPEILNSLAKKNNLKINYRTIGWFDVNEKLYNNEIDLVLPAFKTFKRVKYADFTCLLHRVGLGGVIRSDNAALANLKASDLLSPDIRIAIAKEEIGWEYAENNLDIKENPDRFSVSEDLHIDKIVGYVISNSVDILLVDAVTCSQLCKKHNNILIDVFRKQPLYTTECGILIPQNQESLSSWLTAECKFLLKQKNILDIEHDVIGEIGDIVYKTGTLR